MTSCHDSIIEKGSQLIQILNKAFVVDLKSAHGTFLGYKRLEAHVPTQLPSDIKVN